MGADIDRRNFFRPHPLIQYQPKWQFRWRGQRDATWGVEPSLARRLKNLGVSSNEAALAAAEQDLLTQAKNILLHKTRDGDLTDFELLARLQHHGAATRLLDVSVDPSVALWFAAQGDGDGLLLGFSLRPLQTTQTAELPLTKPVLWTAPPVDLRIRHQRGQFIASPYPSTPVVIAGGFECRIGVSLSVTWQSALPVAKLFTTKQAGRPANESPNIVGVRVLKRLKPELRDYLERGCGFTYTSMFPDLDGFARAWGPEGP